MVWCGQVRKWADSVVPFVFFSWPSPRGAQSVPARHSAVALVDVRIPLAQTTYCRYLV